MDKVGEVWYYAEILLNGQPVSIAVNGTTLRVRSAAIDLSLETTMVPLMYDGKEVVNLKDSPVLPQFRRVRTRRK